jgi:hypothetical protein
LEGFAVGKLVLGVEVGDIVGVAVGENVLGGDVGEIDGKTVGRRVGPNVGINVVGA